MRAAAGLLLLAACGAASTPRPGAPRVGDGVRVLADRPALAMVAREGDPRGAIAVAVMTGGIATDRGAEVAVALAGLVESRLEARGVRDVSVAAGWTGYRVRVLLERDEETTGVVDALRAALLAPIEEKEAAPLAAARRKASALAQRPLPDPALLDSARCTGEPFGIVKSEGPSLADLEAWRAAAHGRARVAFAAVGAHTLAETAAQALVRGGAWPSSSAPAPEPWPQADARPEVYDASGTLAHGAARATLAVHTRSAAQAIAAAQSLGDPRGPLASRLAALDGPAHVKSVTATAHPVGGCVAVVIELGARDLGVDATGRIATAVALARQELAVEIGEAPDDPSLSRAIVLRAGDPRDAAERAAWWTLATGTGPGMRFSIAVGLSAARDGGEAVGARAATLRSDLDRATVAWHAPVVEGRARVERGQGALWMLLASPCGTLAEVDTDAGGAAAVAVAAAEQARGIEAEPWIAADGVGILVHAAPQIGESPAAHARRVADAAARSFAADPLEPALAAHARARLLGLASEHDARVLGALASTLAPGHPSWVAPLGTTEGISRASDASIALRAGALRGGPLRVAVLANADPAQSEAAVQAVDRWIARRPGEVRACPPPSAPPAVKPGTYAVEIPGAVTSEAALAVPIPADEAAREKALVLAAALEGEGGLLSRALGDGAMAHRWSARVVGWPRSPALVVRIVAAHASLDAAVAQTRGLFDRLQKGALTDADRARALQSRAKDDMNRALDPRARLIALWRGDKKIDPPALDALRAFAAAQLREDQLVIVAARPPRSSKPS